MLKIYLLSSIGLLMVIISLLLIPRITNFPWNFKLSKKIESKNYSLIKIKSYS
jgi:hypothetical protein